jgi:hypothetical protein
MGDLNELMVNLYLKQPIEGIKELSRKKGILPGTSDCMFLEIKYYNQEDQEEYLARYIVNHTEKTVKFQFYGDEKKIKTTVFNYEKLKEYPNEQNLITF